ncbi:MAG: TonB-dependent receptor domain-containing protein, partial [Asticcacaulis sp.]
MNGSVNNDTTTNTLTVSAGNPNLKPYTSDEFDLAVEWYFGQVGLVAAGLFHKDIDGLITSERKLNVPYSSTGLPTELVAGITGASNVNEYTRPVNLGKTTLKGLELSAQSDFAFLPAPFNNLGVVANATFIESDTLGMSDLNHNFTLYYETKTWGARISENFRSDYLIDSGGFASTTYV